MDLILKDPMCQSHQNNIIEEQALLVRPGYKYLFLVTHLIAFMWVGDNYDNIIVLIIILQVLKFIKFCEFRSVCEVISTKFKK